MSVDYERLHKENPLHETKVLLEYSKLFAIRVNDRWLFLTIIPQKDDYKLVVEELGNVEGVVAIEDKVVILDGKNLMLYDYEIEQTLSTIVISNMIRATTLNNVLYMAHKDFATKDIERVDIKKNKFHNRTRTVKIAELDDMIGKYVLTKEDVNMSVYNMQTGKKVIEIPYTLKWGDIFGDILYLPYADEILSVNLKTERRVVFHVSNVWRVWKRPNILVTTNDSRDASLTIWSHKQNKINKILASRYSNLDVGNYSLSFRNYDTVFNINYVPLRIMRQDIEADDITRLGGLILIRKEREFSIWNTFSDTVNKIDFDSDAIEKVLEIDVARHQRLWLSSTLRAMFEEYIPYVIIDMVKECF